LLAAQWLTDSLAYRLIAQSSISNHNSQILFPPMVSASIFIIHAIAAFYAFFRYRKEGIGEGLLAVGFMVVIFAVGWTIATMLTNLLFSPEWFVKWFYQPLDSNFWVEVREEFNRDTISLLILTAGEVVFYKIVLSDGKSGKSYFKRN